MIIYNFKIQKYEFESKTLDDNNISYITRDNNYFYEQLQNENEKKKQLIDAKFLIFIEIFYSN